MSAQFCIDLSQVHNLLQLRFNIEEAWLGLRGCDKHMDKVATHTSNQREDLAEISKEEKEEKTLRKDSRKYSFQGMGPSTPAPSMALY